MFSVIVPAYNSAEFIDKCVCSVLSQTYPDFELILVDDGSRDSTLSVCSGYAERDGRVRVIHKENGGHTSARNEGLRASRGSYILFLDSDDWLDEGTLSACFEEIQKRDADIVVFGLKNSAETVRFPVYIDDGCYSTGESAGLLYGNILMGADGRFTFPKSLSGKCFLREVIFDSQLSVPREVLVGEDGAAFVSAMLKAERVSVISRGAGACYNILVRENSVSRTSDAAAFDRMYHLLRFYNELFSRVKFDFSEQYYRYVTAQLYTATLLVTRSGGGRRELNVGLKKILENDFVRVGLKQARFNRRGYKFKIKKFVLRHRFWRLAKLLDK